MSVNDTLKKDREHIGDKPHLWIQWKGTDVCCDIYCSCGAHLHFDGDFLYAFKCGVCGQLYETGSRVVIYPVAETDAFTPITEIEDTGDMCDAPPPRRNAALPKEERR